jgi:hypothetical protein
MTLFAQVDIEGGLERTARDVKNEAQARSASAPDTSLLPYAPPEPPSPVAPR